MTDKVNDHLLAVTIKTASLPRLYTDGWYAFDVTLYGPNPAYGRDPIEPQRIPVATLPQRDAIALIRGAQPGILINQMLVQWQGQTLPLVFDGAAGRQYELLTQVFPERDPFARLRPRGQQRPPSLPLHPRTWPFVAAVIVAQVLAVWALLRGH